MTNEDVQKIGDACKLASNIHEESWIEKGGWGEYQIDMHTACLMACERLGIPKTLARLMDLAFHWGNDLLSWAESPENDFKEYTEFNRQLQK